MFQVQPVHSALRSHIIAIIVVLYFIRTLICIIAKCSRQAHDPLAATITACYIVCACTIKYYNLHGRSHGTNTSRLAESAPWRVVRSYYYIIHRTSVGAVL